MELKELKKVAKEVAGILGTEIATAGVTMDTLVESLKEAIEEAGDPADLEFSPTVKAALLEVGALEAEVEDDEDDNDEELSPYPDEYPAPEAMSKEDFDLLKKEFAELKANDDRDEDEEARFVMLKEHGAKVNEFLKAQKSSKKAKVEKPAKETEEVAKEPAEDDGAVTLDDLKKVAEEMNAVLGFDEADKLNTEAEEAALKTDIVDTLPEIKATDFVTKKGKTTFSAEAAAILKKLGCTKVPAPKAVRAGKPGKTPKAPRDPNAPKRVMNVDKTAFGHWVNSTRGRMDIALEKGGAFKDVAAACGQTEGKVRQHLGSLKKQDGTKFPKVIITVEADMVKVTLA